MNAANIDQIGQLGLRTVDQVVAVAQNDRQAIAGNLKHARPAVADRRSYAARDDCVGKDPHHKVHDPVAGKGLEAIPEACRIAEIVGDDGLVAGVEGVSYQLAVAVEGAGGREEDDGTVLLLRQPKAPRVEGQDCVEARVGDGLEVGSNEEPSALL